MNIYPVDIDSSSASVAERTVFKLAQRSDPGASYLAVHSLLLPRHRRNYIGQADFVVLTPSGLIVIEVKGGVLSFVDGKWSTTGSHGTSSIQSPFDQANNNMWSLRDAAEAASMPFEYKKHLLGFAVVFPDCRFHMNGAGIEPDLIFDASILDKGDPFAEILHRTEKFWTERMPRRPEPMTRQEWQRIKAWLRPRYYSVPSLRSERLALEDRMVALLDEQMDFIVAAKGKQRVICRGGAGTGKTLLGLEICRMRQDQGAQTAFVVRSECLSSYIASRGYEGITIKGIAELKHIDPASLDFICVDEAQDAMNVDDFAEFDRVLRDGIDNGSWLVLMDNQNQSGIDGHYDPDWLRHLESLSDADVWLPRNVRNTEEIIEATSSLSGRDIGKRGTGHGPKVAYLPYRTREEASKVVFQEIEDLAEQEIPLGEIVILERSTPDASCLTNMLAEMGCEITCLAPENARFFPFSTVTSSSIRLFKGMESYVVILDIGDFDLDQIESAEFYVGITRAKAKLVLAYPKSRAKEIASLTEKRKRSQ